MTRSKLPSHLHVSRHGIYGFRLVVPRDLRDRLPQREWRVSMRTRDREEASRRAYRLCYATETFFQRMRQVNFDESVALGRALLDTLKAGSVDDQITALTNAAQISDSRLQPLIERHIALLTRMDELQTQVLERTRALVHALSSAPEASVDGLTADAMSDLAELKDAQSRVRADAMANVYDLQAVVSSLQLERHDAALREEFDNERQVAAKHSADILVQAISARALGSAAAPVPERSTVPPPAPAAPRVTLETVLADFLTDRASSKDPLKPDSINGYHETIELFTECFGSVPLAAVTRTVGQQFVDKLKRLPPNRKKTPAYRKMTIQQLLDANVPTTLSSRTINKHVERVSSLLSWAQDQGTYSVERNPLKGLGVAEAPTKNRRAYTDAELEQLFAAEEFAAGRFDKPFKFWLPLLGLYTGARLSELAQLDVMDIVEEKGCDCISINAVDDAGKKSVKSKAAIRKVPIHPELKRLGFLTWVDGLRRAKATKLFLLPLQEGKTYGHAASKWFISFRKSRGFKTGELDFHSFRVTFISRLLDQGVEQHQVAELVGHERGLITARVYWRPDVGALASLVGMVSHPVVAATVHPYVGG